MTTKLKTLSPGTEFAFEGKRYRKGTTAKSQPTVVGGMMSKCNAEHVLCEPFLGGQFQSDASLGVWIPVTAEVTVE